MTRSLIPALLALTIVSIPSLADDPSAIPPGPPAQIQTIIDTEPGDRVNSELTYPVDALRPATIVDRGYRISLGDVLTLRVRGKVDLHYGSSAGASSAVPGRTSEDTYEVKADGTVQLPMIGPLQAAGQTVGELTKTITDKLSAYYKQFTVDLSVSTPGRIKVWVGGQVRNPGPQTVASTATVLEALLRAGIQPSGSTRLIRLTRGGKDTTVDAYDIVSRGSVTSNVTLQPGDQIFVPAVVRWVKITGETCRPGRFEMIPPKPAANGDCRLSDIISLSLGTLPTAAVSHVIIDRSTAGGEVTALHCDLPAKDDPVLQPGDNIIIPSMADYQPMIRLVGEFRGDGVYQRMAAGTVLNKSGVYKLAQGETVGDVITRTGGTTPQADLRRAKIERKDNGKTDVVPLDLDKLLVKKDRSADVTLRSGDTLILPALQDKVYVFGQVGRPGGMSYEPDRRMLDYLASAGGPAGRPRSVVYLVRGDEKKPQTTRIKLSDGMKGSNKDNPVVQPGDIIYVPEGIITDWRDLANLITTVRIFARF